MKFREILTNTLILVKIEFNKKSLFSTTEREVKKLGKVHRLNILKSSHMKFYQIWSRGCEEMAPDGRTDEAATICFVSKISKL